jgi:hypothetical protein
VDFERNIEEQLNELEMLLRQRRQQLIEFARAERDRRKVVKSGFNIDVNIF